MEKLTYAEAVARDYDVDCHCFPWIGYKGPRFNPDEQVIVLIPFRNEYVDNSN